jgi:hypothetical protein
VNEAGRVVRSYPHTQCIFFDDGRMLVHGADGASGRLRYYVALLDRNGQDIWRKPMIGHHMLNLLRGGAAVAVLSTEERLIEGKDTRMDLIYIFDLNGKLLHEWHVFDHLAEINDVRVTLEVEARQGIGVAVRVFLADHDLRRAAGVNPRTYIPDALVELDRPPPSPAIGLAVEVDLGSEAPSVLAGKARETLALASARTPLWGLSRWRVTLVAPSEKRLRSIARAVTEAGAGAFWFGSDRERIGRTGFLGRSWLSMRAVAEAPAGAPLPYSRSIVGEGGS